jgi:hypothetical protein
MPRLPTVGERLPAIRQPSEATTAEIKANDHQQVRETEVVTSELVLSAKRIWYYSECDEAAFFEWLDKLPCVKHYEGELDLLSIYVDEMRVDENALREFLALFRRYAVDMKQLRVFDRHEFAAWFRDPQAYWHAAVFQEQ